jgi:hypothetical protein
MTYNMKINKKPVTVEVPDPEEITLSGDQLQQLIRKWHRNTAMYLARLQLLKENSVIEANAEKLKFAIEYARMLGVPESQAKETAFQVLKSQDPNFRVESTDTFIFTTEDMLKTLPVVEDTEEE